MSDPFDVLRSTGSDPAPPDIEHIRSRARAVTNRRRAVLGATATVIALVAGVGVFVQLGDEPTEQLARRPAQGARHATDNLEERTLMDSQGLSEADGQLPLEPAPGQSEGSTASASQSTVADGSGLVARLEIEELDGGGAVFAFQVCNESETSVGRDFTDSQRYDFEVLRPEGDVLWRWSEEMAFLQVVGTESWAPGECSSYRERWDGSDRTGAPLAPGIYEAKAVLTGKPPMETPAVAFCHRPC